MIKIKHLNIQFKNNMIVKDIDFTACPGKVILIRGRSGSGKSSILSFIGCLESYPCECYLYDDMDILILSEKEKAELRRAEIGFVFQDNSFINNLTVQENLIVFAELAGQILKRNHIKEYLLLVGLNGKEHELVSSLSGGEKQRLSLICAILKQPKILLGDEITNSVDEENELLIWQIVRKLAIEQHICVIIVSHSDKAKQYADDIYEIKNQRLHVIQKSEQNNTIALTEEKTKNVKHSIKQYMRKNNLMHNWKYIAGSFLISFLLLFSFSLWYINDHKTLKDDMLMLQVVNKDSRFELSEIEDLQKEDGVEFVDYFYEKEIEDAIVQSYDAMQKQIPLKNNELLITANLAEVMDIDVGDAVQLDGYDRTFYVKDVLEYPIYSAKIDWRGKYIYINRHHFADSISNKVIVYINNFEDYSQFCDKMRNNDLIVHSINESDFANQFDGSSLFQRIQQGSILGITVVFLVLNMLIEIYIFMVNLRDFAVLKANGIPQHDLFYFFKEKAKRAVMMNALIGVVIVGSLFVFNKSMLVGISVINFILNLFALICIKILLAETIEYSMLHIFSPLKLLKMTN